MNCWEYIRKYQLENVVLPFIEIGDSNLVASTKRIVKARIRETELVRWRYTCMLYKGLDVYLNVVTEMKPIVWWKFVQCHPDYLSKAAAVVALMMDNQPKSLQTNFDSDICQLCVHRSIDSPVHVLFQCESLHTVRQYIYPILSNSMPPAMLDSFNSLSENGKMVFMFTGTGPEFYDVMKSIASFVYAIYKERKRMYDIFLE